ncbi:MAG: hypothetical protein JKY43_06360, partial [Phycisphaerales bacterium]|nr:hypothetical protein [Phycisphaerales bacterium]
GMISACETAQVKTVITSRKFIDRIPVEHIEPKAIETRAAGTMIQAKMTETKITTRTSDGTQIDARSATLSMALDAAGDAPPCDVCGTITVRSGTCYKCLNCGASMGCS